MADNYFVNIALARPVFSLFTYLAPQLLAAGVRVKVPFGKRAEIGMVIDGNAPAPTEDFTLKPISEVLDEAPLIDTKLLTFIKTVAHYYQYPLGEAIRIALPNLLVHGAENTRELTTFYQVTDAGKAALQMQLGKKQAEVLRFLVDKPAAYDALKAQFAVTPAWLNDLQARGWLSSEAKFAFTPPAVMPDDIALNAEQQTIVSELCAQKGFKVSVLDGVTGSGKTEVYLRWLRELLTREGQCLVLVPEIGLAETLYQRMSKRLAAPCAVFHSGMTDNARLRVWQAVRAGDIRILIGTRSALFAPFPKLSAIIADEFHDQGYKQQDNLRYHAIDMACVRARLLDIPVLLGSATPTLEAYANIFSGKWKRFVLTERARALAPPSIHIENTESVAMRGGLSPLLMKEMRRQLAAKHQIMLFLNRRGYAPILRCGACGWESECEACSAHMTAHVSSRELICHHCGRHHPMPVHCPSCGSADLNLIGLGTQRLEQTVTSQFPQARVLRIDSDAFTTAKQFGRALAAIAAQEVDIIIGTQWLSKGHHFPNIHLVAVIDSDQAFYSNDFRAEERLAQLLVQVGGRAGRESEGLVWVQTHEPQHPVFTVLKAPYIVTAQRLLKEREQAQLPPYSVQVLLFAKHRDEARAMQALEFTRDGATQAGIGADWLWLGPAPAVMLRKDGYARAQLIVQAPTRKSMQQQLPQLNQWLLAQGKALAVKVGLDVDPLWME